MTNIDKLFERVAQKGAVCLGLDTSPDYLPQNFAAQFDSPAQAVYAFNRRVVDATRDCVACYKLQIAYYEALGLDGMKTFSQTLRYVRDAGVPVITDCKRGDIKESAAMYAKAHLEPGGDFESDFVTLNPYMGMDTLEPYEPYLAAGKGCFVLLRTSNAGSRDIQGLETAAGERVFDAVAQQLARFGEKYRGAHGYSSVGVVVGATSGEEAGRLRAALDRAFFLVPGYGAQGGTASGAARCFQNGNGGVVNSSRAILTAYRKHDGGGSGNGDGADKFDQYARAEALRMAKEIGDCL